MTTSDPKNAAETGGAREPEPAVAAALGGDAPPAEAPPADKPGNSQAGSGSGDPGGEPAAWPPREAAPADEVARPEAAPAQPAAAPEPPPPETRPAAEASKGPSPEAVASEAPSPAAVASEGPSPEAALPSEEMPFSNSTLHWLDDGEQSDRVMATGTGPVTIPSYDPTAPVAGRRRAVLVVGGAAVVAALVTGGLYLMAPKAAPAPTAVAAEPARDLTTRAEAAFAANRVGEAIDLARLALVADPRFADAQFVLGNCARARNELPAARDAYREYLVLAPLGTHAADARAALAALPP